MRIKVAQMQTPWGVLILSRNIILSALLDHNTEINASILMSPMLGFKNELVLSSLTFFLNLIIDDKSYFLLSKPNMGRESPFKNNNVTSDRRRYERTQKLVRIDPSVRLWGVTLGWVNAAKKKLNSIRKEVRTNKLNTPILLINSSDDKVVDPKKNEEK